MEFCSQVVDWCCAGDDVGGVSVSAFNMDDDKLNVIGDDPYVLVVESSFEDDISSTELESLKI